MLTIFYIDILLVTYFFLQFKLNSSIPLVHHLTQAFLALNFV